MFIIQNISNSRNKPSSLFHYAGLNSNSLIIKVKGLKYPTVGNPFSVEGNKSCAEPNPSCAEAKESCAEPNPSCAEAKESCAEPNPSCAEVKESSAEPNPSLAVAKESSAEIDPSCAGAKVSSAETKIFGVETGIFCSKPHEFVKTADPYDAEADLSFIEILPFFAGPVEDFATILKSGARRNLLNSCHESYSFCAFQSFAEPV